jgi:hypothetical protein
MQKSVRINTNSTHTLLILIHVKIERGAVFPYFNVIQITKSIGILTF